MRNASRNAKEESSVSKLHAKKYAKYIDKEEKKTQKKH